MTAFPNTIPSPIIGGVITTLNNALSSEMTNGTRVTRKAYSRQLHKIQLEWRGLSTANLSTLRDFYATVNGGAGSFTFTADDFITYTVVFDSDLNVSKVSNSRWNVTCSVVEV